MDTSAIPEPLLALLGLFESDFARVKFPDLDAAVLAEAARGVLSAAERVGAAETALEAARTELHEQQELLLHKGQRALAYARVFAEDSPELLEKLQLIALPRSQKRARTEPPAADAKGTPVRRRGRPPKAKADGPNLFDAGAAEAAEAAESVAAAGSERALAQAS